MKAFRSVNIILAVCVLLSCLSMTAAAQQIPQLQSGETITFSTTKDNHVLYYSFTPQTTGTYVLYDLGDCAFQAWLSVHSCGPQDSGFDQSVVAKGMNQVIFHAEAGVTCWLKLDCSWISGGILSNSFILTTPAASTGIEVGYVSLNSQFVGTEGSLYLRYDPMGSASQITWTTSDPDVVTVDGDANGCRFRLNGPGQGTITATSAEGHRATYTVNALEVTNMAVDSSWTTSMTGNGGYISTEKYVRFTTAESGCYALSVSYDQTLDLWHGVEMSMDTATGYVRSDKTLHIDAEAGKTYTVSVDFWGMYNQKVDYTFRLQRCVPPEGLELVSDATVGYVGTSVNVEVLWAPDNSLGDQIRWSISDSAIAQIASSDDGSALLRLLAEGTVTLTAVTKSGLTASIELTACQHPGTVELVGGANPPLRLLPNDYFECSFTPEATGYYRISADKNALKLQLDGPIAIRNGERLYHLEAGETYFGDIDNLSDELLESVITVAPVEVPTPVDISITRLPDQTQFLPGVLDDIWMYDLLEGMEMTVTWSDGRTTVWSFDTDGINYEGYEIHWQLRDSGANQRELVMKLAEATDSCTLYVKDLSVVSMALVGDDAIQIVERSCGYYDEYIKAWIYSDYLLGMHELLITFNDGSTVTARAGQTVYGKKLMCQMDQYSNPWVKGGRNVVTYSYGKLSIEVPVEIIDSPVRRIQFVSMPRSVFTIGDRQFFVSYGDGAWYFAPESLKEYLEGMTLRVEYHDGTAKVITQQDIQWYRVSGVEYPFVDGYPLGLLGQLMMSYDLITGPCTGEGMVEYMGVSVTYAIELVAPEEGVPGTGDWSLAPALTVMTVALLTMTAMVYKKKQFEC